MKIIGGMKAYTFEEVLDKFYGPVGTPERDAFEAAVEAEVEADKQARKAKEAMREARRARRLAQEPLGSAPAGKVALW